MKSAQGLIGIGITGFISGTAVLLTTEAAIAAATVTGVELNSTPQGINLVLKTKGSDRPQVFSVNRGNTWTADLVNTRLQLSGGNYQKANPAAGIASVSVVALDNNSVRVTVVGQTGAPMGQVNRGSNGDLSFSLSRSKNAAPTAAKPGAKPSIKSANLARATQQGPVTPTAKPLPALPNTITQTPATPPKAIAQAAPAPSSPLPAFQGSTPLVPNPNIKVEGQPYTPPPPVPPYAPLPLPRAVAPPVGDIAVGQTDASATVIDLGTAERVPRLVLRDASAREALALLARSANLNIVFTGDQQQRQGQTPQQQQQAAVDGPKVTLDIVNEPVQNVFNYVLQISGLEANRRGNTIFVGPRLPNSARNIVVRSIRLNQVPVATALPFLVTLGAESAVSRERLVTAVNAIPITNISQAAQGQVGQQQAITQTQTTTEQRLEVQRVDYLDSTPILRGLQVSGDERTNTVTLVGEGRKVEIALAQLTQLDVRRRQVAVNVRVIDIDLLSFERLSSSFSFGVNDTQVVSTGGVGIINFGNQVPSSTGITPGLTQGNPFGVPDTTFGGNPAGLNFARNFLLQIQAAVTNGSAKVLTDPTLLVQEGQRAQVELGEEVITNVRQTTTATQTSSTTTVTVEKAVAGLTLPISVDRIDDNGFISLSIAPLISRPQGVSTIAFESGTGNVVSNDITLLALRRVESGQIRLRDGQSLLLTGIIQDTDRTTVTKVPILGDIPILGALFRRSETQNQRREVVVLLTPRILDDSDRSAFGYSYTPGVETRKILQQTNPQR
ncbi:MAG: AMIN domain-containing protein [Leptolyngbyaceae cyanobacterium bins.302]|nr:AMIN domain-containing protein [Leptolyngbyaceae cyanobacterium bins.302]